MMHMQIVGATRHKEVRPVQFHFLQEHAIINLHTTAVHIVV